MPKGLFVAPSALRIIIFGKQSYIIDEVGIRNEGLVIASERSSAKINDGVINIVKDIHVIVGNAIDSDRIAFEVLSFGGFVVTDVTVVEEVVFMT